MIFLITSFFFIIGDYYLRVNILSREYYLPWQSIRQHSLTPSFTQGRLLFVLIFNIYIGQSNYLKISLLGPPMVDSTPVSHSIAIIYFVALFFRLFPLYINGLVCEFFNLHSFVSYQSFISLNTIHYFWLLTFCEGIWWVTLILMCNFQAW